MTGQLPDRDMSARYRAFRWILTVLSRLLFGFTVFGAEKVPEKGSLILAVNHRGYVDPVLVCMAVPRRIEWMGKKELFAFPFAWFFFFIGTFPVDRQKGGLAAIRTSLSLLKDGWTLGIFPEGTRRKKDDVVVVPNDIPKNGVGMLAARGGAPILPVFVDRMPGPLERLRGGKLRIYVGDPMVLNSTKSEGRAYKGVAGEVLREIYALKAREAR